MKIKSKILTLSISAVILSAVALTSINIYKMTHLSNKNVEEVRNELLATKKEELLDLTGLALSSLKDILRTTSNETEKEAIAERIMSLTYGDSGYFFAYTDKAIVTAQANKDSVGKSHWDLKAQDSGLYIIQELIDAAKRGGDFVVHDWAKPGQEGRFNKLSYAIWLPEVNWMFGTGFYIDDIDSTIAGLEELNQTQIRSLIISSTLYCIVICLVLSCLSLVLTKNIVKPIELITSQLNAIASKGGDLTQRLNTSGNDEVSDLAKAFNLFVEKVHSLIKNTATTSDNVHQSAETSKGLSSKISQSVGNQKLQTDMVATAMNEMSATAQEISNNATEAANSADAANNSCSQAQTVVSQSILSVKTLVSEVDKASSVINELRGDVGEIVTVLDVIRGIAEQTNLLALNAAIEAARAGEQGRGFAVVADEVRTLASRTQDSTQEIQQMIERLQKGSEEAVNVMQANKKVGEETVGHSTSAGNSLDDIASAVDSINNMNAQIANAAREQTQVGESINENLLQMLSETDLTAEATEDSHNTATSLASQSTELSNLIGQFKI